MRLVYAPDGQESQRWPVDLGKLRVAECEQIEKRTGLTYGAEFKEQLLKGGITARRALLFTLLRREHPRTRWEDVDFADDELRLEFDVDELREMRAATVDATGVSEEHRAQALAVLDAEIAAAEDAAAAGEVLPDKADDLGKEAPSDNLPTATG